MPINARQFAQQLAAGALPPVVLIASSEPLLLLEAADALRARARELGFSERVVHEVDARFDWNELHASISAMSLFASQRLIEVRLPTGKPGKEGAAAIEAFCASPASDVLLLITAAEWSRKHEVSWFKAVDGAGATLVLWPPRANELAGWIGQRLASRGVAATPDAAAMLAERVEGNLLAAAQEVDKLAMVGGPGSIDAVQMDRLVADCARYNVFGLSDAALQGNTAHALRMLAGLRAEGDAVVPTLSWIVNQVQTLAALAAVGESGGNVAQAMTRAGVWSSKQALVRQALRRGSASHFERLLGDCARIDRISKGRAQGDPWCELERVIVGIAAPNALPR